MNRSRALCTLLIGFAVAAAATAAPASARSSDLLAGHGNFEKPTAASLGTTYAVGASFDGWKVSTNKVTLSPAFTGVITPPQGKQALALVDAHGEGGGTAGSVCRTIATQAGHRYSVGFSAGVANMGTARIVVKVGSASKSVALPKGGRPVAFKHYSTTVTAAATNAKFCVTASNLTAQSYPVVDAVKVVDAGA